MNKKEVFSLYLDKEVKRKFLESCTKNNLKHSSVIQTLIEKFLEEYNEGL